MTNRQAHIQLRKALVSLYPAREDAERIVRDAQLDPAYISFSDKAINNWDHILSEAEATCGVVYGSGAGTAGASSSPKPAPPGGSQASRSRPSAEELRDLVDQAVRRLRPGK